MSNQKWCQWIKNWYNSDAEFLFCFSATLLIFRYVERNRRLLW